MNVIVGRLDGLKIGLYGDYIIMYAPNQGNRFKKMNAAFFTAMGLKPIAIIEFFAPGG